MLKIPLFAIYEISGQVREYWRLKMFRFGKLIYKAEFQKERKNFQGVQFAPSLEVEDSTTIAYHYH